MSSIECPFCQHKNPSGTRFCSECGSSIYLKICHNPECGKISNVSAEVCEFCGQSFPKKDDSAPEPDGRSPIAAQAGSAAPSSVSPTAKSRIPALPLIIVAIVAGGLPLIWLNRDMLPAPKTWQNTGDAAKSGSAAVPAIVPAPPPAPQAAPAAPLPSPGVADATPPQKRAAAEAGAPGTAKPAASPRKETRTAEPKPAEPPRPCTEAMVALGLCVKKPGSQ